MWAWARFWYSEPAETARPAPLVPPPPPPPPQYGSPDDPSAVARFYAVAGNVLDRAKALVITGGSTVQCVTSSGYGQSSRRALAVTTAPPSEPAPVAPQKDSGPALSTTAVLWIKVGCGVAGVVLGMCLFALCIRGWRRNRRRRWQRPVDPYPLPPPIYPSYYKGVPTMQPAIVLPAESEHYFGSHHRPTPPHASDTYSDAASHRQHSIDILTDLPTGAGTYCVYKGKLQDGTEVAIKKLKTESKQGDREFRAEVEIISRIHHRNLVTLVGYCIFAKERLLVYEFVPNNTLDTHLHGKSKLTRFFLLFYLVLHQMYVACLVNVYSSWFYVELCTGKKGPPLDWNQRRKIAVGSARGLAYLHDDCSPKIIHRDVKASNILLDHNFEPKDADFGLAKYQPGDHTHVSTRIMGTFGYIAPEFLSSGKLTDKADAYAFGVVLLELITGRKPVQSSQFDMDDTLVGWARPLISQDAAEGNFDSLIDPEIGEDCDPNVIMRMIECAAAAVHQFFVHPWFRLILKHLQGAARADDQNSIFAIACAEDTYSSIMESGESVGPRARKTQRSQGNSSSDYSEQDLADRDSKRQEPCQGPVN
ncbi:hypothetical protein ABZP36_005782 [Zizania latifolia]